MFKIFAPLFNFCIIARMLLAFVTTTTYNKLSLFVIIPTVFMWILYSLDILKRDKGPEAEGDIWWKDCRLIHATLYAIAAVCIMNEYSYTAFWILVLDTTFGSYLQAMHRNN